MESGNLYVTAGASQSGKTALTKQEVNDARRLLIWDGKDEWNKLPGVERITSLHDWVRRVQTPGPIRAAFVTPNPKLFSPWAKAVFYSGKWAGEQGARTVVVGEELGQVTQAGRAQEGWHLLLSQGLGLGFDIHSLAQRVAEAEKTSLGNASVIRCFMQPFRSDRKRMADALGVSEEDIDNLKPLEYIQRNMRTKDTVYRRLSFPDVRKPG